MDFRKYYLILFIAVSTACNAQFKKQFILGAGGQFDKYTITIKTNSPNARPFPGQRTIANYGFGLEMGYYVFNNLSCSYKLVYQNYCSSIYNTSAYTTSFMNGLIIEKLFQLQDNIYFNIGAMPFYEKIYQKSDYLGEVIETNNQGSICTMGFSFVLDKNILLGAHVFRKFNSYTDDYGYSSPAGFIVSVKYIFKKDLFKGN